MTPNEYDKYLCNKYPNLYRDRNAPMSQTCLCWGFEIGMGWAKILDDLSAKLESFILELPENERPQVKAVQVKSKFGGLRFYMSLDNEKISEAIEDAEEKASKTCEECGNEGQLVGSPWVYTLCEECWAQNNYIRGLRVALNKSCPECAKEINKVVAADQEQDKKRVQEDLEDNECSSFIKDTEPAPGGGEVFNPFLMELGKANETK